MTFPAGEDLPQANFLPQRCYGFRWTENYYRINFEKLLDVNNYITCQKLIPNDCGVPSIGQVRRHTLS